MRKPVFILLMAVLIFAGTVRDGRAKVYQTMQKTYKTTSAPLDITTSENGQHTFVLTRGKVLIYGKSSLEDTISVGPDFDHISAAITGDKIFLSSNKDKKVQVVLIDFVKHIDISGSPFLGPENARVTLVVFSDFQ
ncbi:MAG: hypothetical protein GXP59_01945 [Deltaproteobacteria bacterium]|nr:hypothetical protein [Deltaproteobacteria bacterium]